MIGKQVSIDRIIELGFEERIGIHQFEKKSYYVFSALNEAFYNRYMLCEKLDVNTYKILDLYYIRKGALLEKTK